MTTVKFNNRPVMKTWNGIVSELFNDLEQSLPQFATQNGRNITPVNIAENESGFHIELLAPARKKEQFKIETDNNVLTLSYEEAKAEPTTELKQIRREFTTGNFKRTFALDEKIDAENIQAKYEDGILKVFLPKKPETKPANRTIEIL